MDKLLQKIERHPRSDAGRAYRLGLAEGQNGALQPLAKLALRYWLLRTTVFRSRKQDNELTRLRAQLFEITNQ